MSPNVEAAHVPQQLLGELFVEKGLITLEELAEALAEQQGSGKRIGHILVEKGFVSGPALATVLAEQLGVDMEKQEGFGSGLWTEIKRRHPRDHDAGVHAQEAEEAKSLSEPRLALVDEPPSAHVLFLPSAKGYSLAERAGPPPEVGAGEELEGIRFRVARIGCSPLPADRRRCAYLEAV